MTELQNGLPPGWDCKFDRLSGRFYYVNHYTKTTTWEDPRRTRHISLHGTPKHMPNVPVEHIPLQEMRPVARSPLTLRNARVQDSSLTSSSHSSSDTDDSVAKISAMFPTVSETHIKLLLKNCRYMKSLFANADEDVILECLQNNDNNIQMTSEMLKEMGYSRKETLRTASPKIEPAVVLNEGESVARAATPPPVPKMKSKEEKQQMKVKLQQQYADVPEHLISIALESVNFDENRANQILQIMKQEDSASESNRNQRSVQSTSELDATPSTSQTATSQLPVSQSRQSIKSLLKSEKKDEIGGFSRIVEQNDDMLKSLSLSNTTGHNPELSKGPNDKLLLENYIQWQGSNKTILKGPQGLSKGHNKDLLSNRVYSPCGPNSELRKGPMFGLAKGSLFNQLKSVVVGESRVK